MALWLVCVAVILVVMAAGWWAARMALAFVILRAVTEVLARPGSLAGGGAAFCSAGGGKNLSGRYRVRPVRTAADGPAGTSGRGAGSLMRES